jgi:DNA-binding GntR family transcriptional regulator
LRGSILGGELEPGQRVSPGRLATQFGVSVTPVREALRLLEEEGLIDVSPRRWTRVSVPDPKVAEEVYPIVAVLEELAVTSAPAASIDDIASARDANAMLARAAVEQDVLACARADADFHDALLRLSHNARLIQTIHDLKARILLLESVYYRADRAAESVKQHRAIIDALVQGEMEQAGLLVAENWRYGFRTVRDEILGRSAA